ncbi:MAG TPA: LPXTG cell wall anchor domain-containing protein [Gemmatimonadaceae bacterium]|nr:LPXTG cell wall anchor domain-containing protein [Gemmatimonadaceae bacterium]
MSNETQHQADEPPAEDRNGVTIVILGAVLLALGAFFVRRAL